MLAVCATLHQVGGITNAAGAAGTLLATVTLLLNYARILDWALTLTADGILTMFEVTILGRPPVTVGCEVPVVGAGAGAPTAHP